VVTGATLGLMQDSTTEQAILLVPAWLFHLRGEPTPMAIVAIDAAYLVDSGLLGVLKVGDHTVAAHLQLSAVPLKWRGEAGLVTGR